MVYYFSIHLCVNVGYLTVHFCFEVRQVALPFSRPMTTEAESVTVKEQTVPKPPASITSEAVSSVVTKANMKQTASSESKKSTKPDKKQGIYCQLPSLFFFFVVTCACFCQ